MSNLESSESVYVQMVKRIKLIKEKRGLLTTSEMLDLLIFISDIHGSLMQDYQDLLKKYTALNEEFMLSMKEDIEAKTALLKTIETERHDKSKLVDTVATLTLKHDLVIIRLSVDPPVSEMTN